MIHLLQCFFGSEGHVALDRNLGPGYNSLLMQFIPGDDKQIVHVPKDSSTHYPAF